jgi:hypothetical protein
LNTNETHIELFDQYLLNQLSEAERKAFEERLQNDLEFKEAFEIHQILVQGIQFHGKAELKDFLKENATVTFWGGNIWPQKMRIASVAVFLVFAGMYALVHFYLKPQNQSNNTAIVSEKSTETVQSNPTSIDSIQAQPSTELPNLLSEGEVMNNEIPVIEEDFQNPVEALDDNIIEYEMESEVSAKESMDYQVLKERKLSDTILLAVNIPVNYTYKTDALNKSPKKSKSPTIPSNTQNSPLNNNSGVLNTDTAFTAKAESNETKGLSKKIVGPAKYNVEFWTSPINFKGYKLIKQTLQLYGLGSASVQLKVFNNQLYLIHKQTVYVLNPCIDGCAYKPLNDEELESLLLDN